jgi:hypothetical protein
MLDVKITAGGDGEHGPAVTVLTQSVDVRRSWRSLLRVMIRSPTLARFPSASATSALLSSLA